MYFFYKHILCNVISRHSTNIYYIKKYIYIYILYYYLGQTSLTVVLHPNKHILKRGSTILKGSW